MNPEYEIAYLDVDNTLMTGDDRPSENMLNALRRIPKKGVNTTRSIAQTEKVILATEVNLPSIVLGGAEVWDPGKEMIKAFPISEEARAAVASLIIDQSEKIKLARFHPTGSRQLVFYAASDEIETKFRGIYAKTNGLKKMFRGINEFSRALIPTQVSAILIRTNSDTTLDIPPALRDLVEVDDSIKGEVTITQSGVTKASTLLWVCNYLEVSPDKVLTAGDSDKTDAPVFAHTHGISVGPNIITNSKENVVSIEDLADLLQRIYS